MAGLFVPSPFVLYQVWMLISPGLYRNEKRYVFPFMFSTVLLFLAGGGIRVLTWSTRRRGELPNRLRQTVPTDDHDWRVHGPVPYHYGWGWE